MLPATYTKPSESTAIEGTWDMTHDEDGDPVPSGTVTLVFSGANYSVSDPECNESGTFTVNGNSAALSSTESTPKAGVPASNCTAGGTDTVQYVLNGTTMTVTAPDGEVYTFVKR